MSSSASQVATELVWYASYGSNMDANRFRCYLAGGVPVGARRGYPGCRNPQPPLATRAHFLPGGIYFATESPVWGGGRAFYDRKLSGTCPARAYLITAGQFSDVTAQEMHRPPGSDFDLSPVVTAGEVQLGPGRYETLLCTGEMDGYPVLTFTAPWSRADVAVRPPSAAYLRMLAQGLCDAHGWTIARAANYLANRPGAAGVWTPERIAEALAVPDG